MYYVYSHSIVLPSGVKRPFYVGKGKRSRGKSFSPRNKFYKHVLNKHGAENVTFDIWCDNLKEDEAFERETELISLMRDSGIKLTNMTNGGEGSSGYKHDPDHIESIRGNKFAKGSVRSDRHKAAIKAAQMGNKHTLGRKMTSEEIEKSANSRRGLPSPLKGRKSSEETKLKISKALMGKTVGSKWMNDGARSKRVRAESVSDFISEGWMIGRLKK